LLVKAQLNACCVEWFGIGQTLIVCININVHLMLHSITNGDLNIVLTGTHEFMIASETRVAGNVSDSRRCSIWWNFKVFVSGPIDVWECYRHRLDYATYGLRRYYRRDAVVTVGGLTVA
jgi:hypothetical protein